MKKTSLLFLVVVFTLSCNNVIDKKVSIKSAKEDFAKIKEEYKDKYTADEFAALSDDMGRQFINGGSKTYRELLDTIHAKKLKYNSDLLSYKKTIDSINNILLMKIDTAAYIQQDVIDVLGIRADVLNKSNKIITGIKGIFLIYDVFGKKIKTVYVERTGTVKPHEPYTDVERSPIISNDDENALKETPFDKLKWEWQPQIIVFDDETKIEAPTKPRNPLKSVFEDE